MKRRKFLGIAGGTIVIAGVAYYLLSDKSNFTRDDFTEKEIPLFPFQPGEREILFLASLAPSGHNTQPWFVKYVEPYHWIIGNDKNKWLPAVDPSQRETILSIGAFLQNLEYAAAHLGYNCQFTLLAHTNKDEQVMEVLIKKTGTAAVFDIQKIKDRRTVRSNYQDTIIDSKDLQFITAGETDLIHYLPRLTKESNWLNEQTIEANRIQAYRDDAQKELAHWIRFSSRDAEKYCDGLTTASMEIEGIPAWVLRNFYNEKKVMGQKFREQSLDKVRKQVAQSGGWLLITSKDLSVLSLLETGKRMQRLFLRVREKGIAIHPMTQVLEEKASSALVQSSTGISDPVQFILRTGYLEKYPVPVSLRRPVEKIIRV